MEREIAAELREMGYEAVTSRQESRSADAAGIDIISNIPFEIQCKASKNQPQLHQLLTETEATAVFYRKMEKKGKRFYAQGDYVIISKGDFYKLLKREI